MNLDQRFGRWRFTFQIGLRYIPARYEISPRWWQVVRRWDLRRQRKLDARYTDTVLTPYDWDFNERMGRDNNKIQPEPRRRPTPAPDARDFYADMCA